MSDNNTFRDYGAESFGGGEFSIETKGSWAVLRLALNHPELAEAYYFDADTARHLGVKLLNWVGGPGTCTLEPVKFTDTSDDVLQVEVIDGTVMFLLCDGKFQATDEEVIDLAVRLIAWAGPAPVPVDA